MDLCVFHSADMDGWCSGALIHRYCGYDCKFKGFNYSPSFDIDEFIEKYSDCETIYIVDASFKISELVKVLKAGFNVVWIDHHKTAISDYAKSGHFKSKKFSENIVELTLPNAKFVGYVSEKYSASKIVYEVLISDKSKTIASIVNLVSIFDTWNVGSPYWEQARKFNAGCGLYNLMPWKEEWKDLFNNENVLEGILEEGDVVVRYQNTMYERIAYSHGGTLEFEGYTWFCINDLCNSLLADTMFDPKVHDAILYFKYKPDEKMWKLGFYNSTKKQGVKGMNKIAEKYGIARGGGHDAAAGCMVKELPFRLEDIKPLER